MVLVFVILFFDSFYFYLGVFWFLGGGFCFIKYIIFYLEGMFVDCCIYVIFVKLVEVGVVFLKFFLLLVDESWFEVLWEEL